MRRTVGRHLPFTLLLAAFYAGGTTTLAQHPASHGDPAADVGRVSFRTSCAPAVSGAFNRGVAMLHSFWFPAAIEQFDAVLAKDPNCAMAWWGKAMSSWGNPFAPARSPAALAAGLQAITRARALAATDRERAYVAAAGGLFDDAATVPNRRRTLAYESAMAALHATYPDDDEAAVFYALALAQTAVPSDKTYANLLKAGAILEGEWAKYPDHPGIAHYIIHSYDVPALAGKALAAARRYAAVAPAVPHALHMPSHTFTRVGSWQESVDTNLASARAARANGSASEELHALDYQVYAYLQMGDDAQVQRIVADLPGVVGGITSTGTASAAPPVAGLYASAAIPARYALERGDWSAAAALPLNDAAAPYAKAVTLFARVLGSARDGHPDKTDADLDALAAVRDALLRADQPDPADEVEIARLVASAWRTYATGAHAEALELLRAAADRQDASEDSSISPGPLAPARELLAEMLLEEGRPADARREFEATLENYPRRFRSLAGAGQAAALTGDRDASLVFYRTLVMMCDGAEQPGRPALAAARRAVASVTP